VINAGGLIVLSSDEDEGGRKICGWRSFKLSDHVIAPDHPVSDIIQTASGTVI
jgi:hypothetical protein